MNPFDEFEQNDTIQELSIVIRVETRGRKKNTYITGWAISEDELKDHVKSIKKSCACNGSIKDVVDPLDTIGESHPVKTIQFQGDVVDFVTKYIINLGVNPNSISKLIG